MGERREKQTLIPAFDPEALAKELEAEASQASNDGDRPTSPPAFDPAAYARMVDERAKADAVHDTPHTMTAATPLLPVPMIDGEPVSSDDGATAAMGRAMYGSYLSSDYPEALVLAERVLEREPEHALAKLVLEGCRERLEYDGPGASGHSHSDEPSGVRLSPTSVVRLTRPPFEVVEELGYANDAMLGAIDGVCDVTMVAALAGLTKPEALERLHALLALGYVEVVA